MGCGIEVVASVLTGTPSRWGFLPRILGAQNELGGYTGHPKKIGGGNSTQCPHFLYVKQCIQGSQNTMVPIT